jgi:general secretion pathway protein L
MSLTLILPAPDAAWTWLRLDGDTVLARGTGLADLVPEEDRLVLAAPAERVALHFLDLPPGLSRPQAQAAARLQLESEAAEPLSTLHIAIGAGEAGRCCAAIARIDDVTHWLDALRAHGLAPDALIPAPLLLSPRSGRWLRHDLGGQSLYRREGEAFGIEPDVGALLTAGSEVETLDRPAFEAQLAGALANPPVDLLTGPFARRRTWRVETSRLRDLAALLIAILSVTLLQQVADMFRYSHAAGRVEQETDQGLAQQRGGPDAAARLSDARARDSSFARLSAALFGALRAIPDTEVKDLTYRGNALQATLRSATPEAAAAVQQAVARSGYRVQTGQPRAAGTVHETPLRIDRP